MARSQTSVRVPVFEADRALRKRFVCGGMRQSQSGVHHEPVVASNDASVAPPVQPVAKKQPKPRIVTRAPHRR